MNSNKSASVESVDVIVECQWERQSSGKIQLDCNFGPLEPGEVAPSISEENKQHIEEVIEARVPYVRHQMEDVARARVFGNDSPPLVLLTVDPVEGTTPHENEAAILPL